MAAGCTGGLHREGDRQITLVGSYGEPIKDAALWYASELGRGQNTALELGYNHFFEDRLAFMVGLTPYKIFNQSDGDVYAAEFQIGFRWYFWEFDLGSVPVGLFGEILGGVMQAAKSVPEEGSHFNFTQDTGLGFEAQFTDRISWIGGYRMKHLSNAQINGYNNPAQNDHHFYTGIAIALN
jgi:hypothetical protein